MQVIGCGGCSLAASVWVIQIHCRGVNPTEKHINLSGYYCIINKRAGFYGHGPKLLSILHRVYLNSIWGGVMVALNGVKHEIVQVMMQHVQLETWNHLLVSCTKPNWVSGQKKCPRVPVRHFFFKWIIFQLRQHQFTNTDCESQTLIENTRIYRAMHIVEVQYQGTVSYFRSALSSPSTETGLCWMLFCTDSLKCSAIES